MLTLFSIGAYAQTQQGQSSFGFNLGYNFNDVGNATIGIDYRYCVTDAFRLTPSITHLVKNDGVSAWAIDMNAHYVFKLSEMFGFYPLAGLSLSFWKAGPWDATRFGANIGLGGEVYATDRVSVGLEAWCSSAGRAPALQAGGQEFDPPHLHHRASEDEETTTVAKN